MSFSERSKRKLKHAFAGLLSLLALAVCIVIIILFQRTTLEEYTDPTAQYRVEISAYLIDQAAIRMPGQSGDIPVLVEIFDQHENSMGRMPVLMRNIADVRFNGSEAAIDLIGHWNFQKGTCTYIDQQKSVERTCYLSINPALLGVFITIFIGFNLLLVLYKVKKITRDQILFGMLIVIFAISYTIL